MRVAVPARAAADATLTTSLGSPGRSFRVSSAEYVPGADVAGTNASRRQAKVITVQQANGAPVVLDTDRLEWGVAQGWHGPARPWRHGPGRRGGAVTRNRTGKQVRATWRELYQPVVSTIANAAWLLKIDRAELARRVRAAGLRPWGAHASGEPVFGGRT